jgi:endonuclease YncB( thermonuclease family)
MLNEIIVRLGLATASKNSQDAKYFALLAHAEEEARRARRGVWATSSIR